MFLFVFSRSADWFGLVWSGLICFFVGFGVVWFLLCSAFGSSLFVIGRPFDTRSEPVDGRAVSLLCIAFRVAPSIYTVLTTSMCLDPAAVPGSTTTVVIIIHES